MKMIKKLFAPKEIRAILGVLDEASYKFDYPAFSMVKKIIEDSILSNPSEFAQQVRDGLSPRESVYNLIANIAGDHVESGQYHIYRGVLNPLGMGKDLLKIFDNAIDELVAIEAIDEEFAKETKDGIRSNLRDVG